jgi:hypothetical protein
LLPLVIESSSTISTDSRDKIYSVIVLARELYGNQLQDLRSRMSILALFRQL